MRCPLCDNKVYNVFQIAKSPTENVQFGYCRCGCIHNSTSVDVLTWDAEFLKSWEDIKYLGERYEYQSRVYMPLIEELTYGRDALDVGSCGSGFADLLSARGWNVDSIDLIPNAAKIQGDFETYDFFDKGQDYRYDFIMMGNVLQSFKDPVKAIYKAYNLLKPNGLLFVITPNTDLLRNNPVRDFGHFNHKEVNCLINYNILKDIYSRVDESLKGKLNILLAIDNIEGKRFITSNVMHVIAQKKVIETIPSMDDMMELMAKKAPEKV